jgi:putative aldouronate transport system permease protein
MDPAVGAQASRPIVRRKSLSTYLRDNLALYLFLLAPIAYFVIFKYVPMYGVTIAFKDYNIFSGILGSPWNHFATFRKVFAMAEFYRAVRNTFVLNFLDLLFGFPSPIMLAIILTELRSELFKKLSQTVVYLPHFFSWVIIGSMALQIFSAQYGVINNVLASVGLRPIPFLTDKWVWVGTYTLLGVWQSLGWNAIIYLAAIAGINSELYEAAAIDGAGRLARIWHVTLPGILPTIMIMLILQLGRMMQIAFDRPYIIGNSLVVEHSDVISTYVVRVGLQALQFSLATAVGLFQSVVGLFFLLAANYAAERSGQQGIWG